MKHVKLFEQFINESDAYTISRMANDIGLGPAQDFLDAHDVDIELLKKDISQGTINKYELRDIIKGNAPSSKIKKFIKTYVNESVVTEARAANYKILVDVLLNAQPNYDVYYNDSHNVVNVGGVGYSGGDLTRALKLNPGQADSVKNEFYYAKEDPKETKKQIEKLSKGKIEVDISGSIVKYKVNESVVTESKFKVGDKWEWNTSDGIKVVSITNIKSNGDVVGREEGRSEDFIVRDANKYLKKKVT